ncbi:MAG: hypothetical protein HY335_06190 [Deinococcus sp.]|nr:hypothetical protein [Deinococcus sp.]
MNSTLLGIDLGTSGCKVSAFDLAGQELASSRAAYSLDTSSPGQAILDPLQVWKAVRESIQACAAQLRQSHQPAPAALAVTALGEAVTAVDQKGQPLGETLTAFDFRGERDCRWLAEQLGAENIYQRTGVVPHPMFTASKLLWWARSRPELWRQSWRFLDWTALANLWLCGQPVTDYSHACRTMLFRPKDQRWDEELLTLTKLEAERLPITRPAGSLLGPVRRELAQELGLSPHTQVVVGGFDQACADLGCGVVEPGQACDSLGTTSCLTVVSARAECRPALQVGQYMSLCHVVPQRFLVLGGSLNGTIVLRWWSERCPEIAPTALDSLPLEPSPVLCLPHLAGAGQPWGDPRSKGAILGLTLSSSGADIAAALAQGIIQELRYNLDRLSQILGPITEIRTVGGAARSQYWLELKAAICQRKILRPREVEATSLGAAILAALGIQAFPTVQAAVEHMVAIEQQLCPDPARGATFSRQSALFNRVYDTLKDLLHEL